MTREKKCEFLIKKGYTYNPETGFIFSRLKKQVTHKDKNGYIQFTTTISYRKCIAIFAHQFAWYWVNRECVEQIDHINGIKDDNRISNLRAVTQQQNQWNRTTAKGYCWCKSHKKWKTQIKINCKQINLGYYNTEQEARSAYLAAKEIYHKI